MMWFPHANRPQAWSLPRIFPALHADACHAAQEALARMEALSRETEAASQRAFQAEAAERRHQVSLLT